jgi:monovalent cation/proton antiporter MnhG/PhaG subunit
LAVSFHDLLVGGLLAIAVLLVLMCAIGVLVMRDPYQRLHYIAPPTTISVSLITLAVWLDEPQRQAGLKMIVITIALGLMNGVVTHASARAFRIRAKGHWVSGESEEFERASDEKPAE